MKLEQRALRFPSGGNALIGIVDVPERPLARGMLLLHDSLQYRAGSHRQFTLLSRLLAARGVAVMRFDRGASGDSGGGLDAGGVDHGADIAAAMKEFFIHVPEIKESVILAPGDAIGHALAYACGDPRITGLALLDPAWAPAPPAAIAAPKAAYSAADRLFRRASAFRRAATRAAAASAPSALDRFLGDYAGEVLVVGARESAIRAPRARTRHVALAPDGIDLRRSAWRDGVAFACASWLTSW